MRQRDKLVCNHVYSNASTIENMEIDNAESGTSGFHIICWCVHATKSTIMSASFFVTLLNVRNHPSNTINFRFNLLTCFQSCVCDFTVVLLLNTDCDLWFLVLNSNNVIFFDDSDSL
jgi:hypothetical protein